MSFISESESDEPSFSTNRDSSFNSSFSVVNFIEECKFTSSKNVLQDLKKGQKLITFWHSTQELRSRNKIQTS